VLTNCSVAPATVLTRVDFSVTFCVAFVIFLDASVWPFAETSNTVRFLPLLMVVVTENALPAREAEALTGTATASDATTADVTAARAKVLIRDAMTGVPLFRSPGD
jgi:hypothetical protein